MAFNLFFQLTDGQSQEDTMQVRLSETFVSHSRHLFLHGKLRRV